MLWRGKQGKGEQTSLVEKVTLSWDLEDEQEISLAEEGRSCDRKSSSSSQKRACHLQGTANRSVWPAVQTWRLDAWEVWLVGHTGAKSHRHAFEGPVVFSGGATNGFKLPDICHPLCKAPLAGPHFITLGTGNAVIIGPLKGEFNARAGRGRRHAWHYLNLTFLFFLINQWLIDITFPPNPFSRDVL